MLHTEMVEHVVLPLALLSQGAQEELVVKWCAPLLEVQKAHILVGMRADCFPNPSYVGLVRAASLQEPTVPPDYLVIRILCKLTKCLTRVDDRVVGQARVGDAEVMRQRIKHVQEHLILGTQLRFWCKHASLLQRTFHWGPLRHLVKSQRAKEHAYYEDKRTIHCILIVRYIEIVFGQQHFLRRHGTM